MTGCAWRFPSVGCSCDYGQVRRWAKARPVPETVMRRPLFADAAAPTLAVVRESHRSNVTVPAPPGVTTPEGRYETIGPAAPLVAWAGLTSGLSPASAGP